MAYHEIWFWQLIVSPHMAGLARALAESGHKVVYAAQQNMTPQRAAQGWQAPQLGKANLQLVPTLGDALTLAERAPSNATHICQGIRGNGQISKVQRHLTKLGRKQWVVMETVDDEGWRGIAKRVMYSYLFRRLGSSLQGVLATGRGTDQWIASRGVPADKVYPFAYFLPDSNAQITKQRPRPPIDDAFKILFVGQLIERKRLDLLIAALEILELPNVELLVVGSGPLEANLRRKAEKALGAQLNWMGKLHMEDVRKLMAKVDCLVLPSRHDGWGAVVVESLMAGTPAICSDRCGAAEAVIASEAGGVFKSGDVRSLVNRLTSLTDDGAHPALERERLAKWAGCFEASSGAVYLADILDCMLSKHRPTAPWLKVEQ